MKKIIVIFICIISFMFLLYSEQPANAAKKGSKKSAISKEEMVNIVNSINTYSKKVYANSLFSPKEMENLIQIKLKLDDQMLVSPDPEYAPLYFKMGNVYKAREKKDDAVDCYQTIMENFSDTVFYPKARKKLEDMGVTIKDSASSRLNLPTE